MAKIWRKKKGIKEFMELLYMYPPFQGEGFQRNRYKRSIRSYAPYNFNIKYIQDHYDKIKIEVINDYSQTTRTYSYELRRYVTNGEVINRLRTEEELIKDIDNFIYNGIGWTDVRKLMDFKEIGLYQSRLNKWRVRYESK